MPLVEFTFEELPLIVDLGFEAGLVTGSAEIHAHPDGEWFVDKIFLDGHRRDTPLGPVERRPVEVADRKSWLYLTILDQLENGTFKDSVVDAVRAAIDGDDVGTSRSEFSEHSTLNHAQQGV